MISFHSCGVSMCVLEVRYLRKKPVFRRENYHFRRKIIWLGVPQLFLETWKFLQGISSMRRPLAAAERSVCPTKSRQVSKKIGTPNRSILGGGN